MDYTSRLTQTLIVNVTESFPGRMSFVLLNCREKILDKNPELEGIFVPGNTRHMPIGIRQ